MATREFRTLSKLIFVLSMLSLHVRPPRSYKGRRAKSRLITHTTRVPLDWRPPPTTTKPPNPQAKQGGSAGVFRFEPNTGFNCCKKKCMSHFKTADDIRVMEARKPLYNMLLTTDQKRTLLRENWKKELLIQHKGQQRAVCLTCACMIYACSRAKLCPGTSATGRSRADSNAARAKKNVSISSWFYALMETLDIMPDTGYYQLQCGRKNMLLDDYLLDAQRWPDLYLECNDSYFYQIWRESFPNVKLRKHCRFAKCEFCIDKREAISSPIMSELEKADARERLKMHLNWAHTRERGFYHSKRNEAIRCPQKKLSISIDGTDQFINGFPHFWEVTKQDAKGKRFYLHTQVAIVHGVGPSVYLACEDIAGDPNWTVETLYRTLKAEEERRGEAGLPKTMYLQLDNCFRENKNTYLIAYLCWLIERRVFDEIFLSFLPTGHTHFDPDQFASRIATAVRFRNVLTCDEYARIVRECWGHKVAVEWVDNVMDIKELFNPGKDEHCPVSTSRVRRTRGIGTKSVQPGRDWFMGATSPLHWRVRRDTNNKVFVQSKFTVDDTSWGQAFYPWTDDAPRPDGRSTDPGFSGLLPSDVVLAPNNPLSEARIKELRSALQNVRPRLPDVAWEEVQEMLQLVTTLRKEVMPDGYGILGGDLLEHDEEQPEEAQLFSRPTTVFASQSHQARAREQRRTQGHASKPITIQSFVAYTTHYASTYPEDQMQAFWVGKVIGVDADEGKVNLQRWHTGTVDNLNLDKAAAKYRVWTGRGPKTEWIEITRVLEVFDLTPKGNSVSKGDMRNIENALKLVAAMQSNSGVAPDLAVGRDFFENPVQDQEQDLMDEADRAASQLDDE